MSPDEIEALWEQDPPRGPDGKFARYIAALRSQTPSGMRWTPQIWRRNQEARYAHTYLATFRPIRRGGLHG